MRKMLSLAALAALAGCTVGPNYERPDVAVPPTYARQAAAAAAAAASDVDVARWWTAFGDPRLTALIERALADNPTIQIAASRVRQARLEEIVARAAGRPQINLGANATRVEFSRNGGFASIARQFQGGQAGGGGLALPGTGITTYAIGFDASWELDLFGGARRQREAAAARAEAAEWSARDAGVTLAAEIADAYFALRLDQAQIALIEAEMAGRRRQIEIAEHQARAGLTPSIDTLRATGELTQARARIEPLRADAELRMHALGLLIGQPPEAPIADLSAPGAALGAPPAVPAGLPSDLLRRRPDIRAAERRLAAATADIGVQVAQLYPRISLTGSAQLLSSGLSNLIAGDSFQGLGQGAISFPLLDWGRRRANVRIAREAGEQAYTDYKATVLQALRDVEDPLSRIDAERRRGAALRQALADAERTRAAIAARFEAGLVAQDAVIAADVARLQAEAQVAASDALLRQLTAALFKAIGGGWDGAAEKS